MKIDFKSAFLLAPLLVMAALPAGVLAHFGGSNVVTVHPELCHHRVVVKESGSLGHDDAMDCSECDDCCSGAGVSAEPATPMKVNFVLKRLATNQFFSSFLTSLSFKAPERPPKLLS